MASAKRAPITAPTSPGHETSRSVSRKEQQLLRTIRELGDTVFNQEPTKVFDRSWPIGDVAQMVGISRQMIRHHEIEGGLPRPEKLPNGRYPGYTLEQINRMRDYFGTRYHRQSSDEPMVLSFSTHKRDLCKSTLSVHLAQYLAIRGYRVLFIDSDPAANASSLFGLNTDLEMLQWHYEALAAGDQADTTLNYTLDEFYRREFREFANAVRASYFPGIDLVPGSGALAEAEHDLTGAHAADPDRLNDLKRGIESVQDDYDVVIIDPSPTIGPLSRLAQNAATALAIPMQPTPGHVASTARFLSLLRSNLERRDAKPGAYKFEALVVNNLDESNATHRDIAESVRTRLAAEDLISAMMTDTSEIERARKDMRTLYDQAAPKRAKDPIAIAVRYLDRINGEIETRIRRTWSSHHEKLLREAQL